MSSSKRSKSKDRGKKTKRQVSRSASKFSIPDMFWTSLENVRDTVEKLREDVGDNICVEKGYKKGLLFHLGALAMFGEVSPDMKTFCRDYRIHPPILKTLDVIFNAVNYFLGKKEDLKGKKVEGLDNVNRIVNQAQKLVSTCNRMTAAPVAQTSL